MVEMAGIEPASERIDHQTSTSLVGSSSRDLIREPAKLKKSLSARTRKFSFNLNAACKLAP